MRWTKRPPGASLQAQGVEKTARVSVRGQTTRIEDWIGCGHTRWDSTSTGMVLVSVADFKPIIVAEHK